MDSGSYKGSEISDTYFHKKIVGQNGVVTRYEVKKFTDDPWPEDVNLINFCYGRSTKWGGKVRIVGDTAYIDVYVD